MFKKYDIFFTMWLKALNFLKKMLWLSWKAVEGDSLDFQKLDVCVQVIVTTIENGEICILGYFRFFSFSTQNQVSQIIIGII